MPKKEIEKGSTELEVEPTPSTAETVEPTPEEQVATLQTQIQELTKQVGEKDESYKGLQRTLNTKDAELKKRGDIDARIDGLEETQKILVGMLDEKMGEVDPEKKTDYLKQFETVQEKQKTTREAAGLKSQQEEYNRKCDALYTEAKTVFKGDEEQLEKVEDLLMSGRYDRAEARVSKAKETKMPNEPKGSTESEDEVFERMARKRGLLKGESLTPAGKTRTPEQVLQDFNEGKASFEEYAKVRDQLTFQNSEK